MKKLIVTRSDDNIKEMTDISHPIIKKFAHQWGANFLSLDHVADCNGNGKFHFRIMKCYDLYEEYDRILSLDSDILISPKCPNLFDLIPEECIGTVFEDVGTRSSDRSE